MEAAAYVDAQLVAFAHKVGPVQLDRLVEQAIARFMPEQAAENVGEGSRGAGTSPSTTARSPSNGTTWMEAELDLADALDLDAAITARRRAAPPRRVHRVPRRTPRHRRRPARPSPARSRPRARLPPSSEFSGRPDKRRQVVLYVHLSEAAISGNGGAPLAQVDKHRRTVLADQVRTWCASPDANVVVKPVIDLDEHIPASPATRGPRASR